MSKLQELSKAIHEVINDNFDRDITEFLLVVPNDYDEWKANIPQFFWGRGYQIDPHSVFEVNILSLEELHELQDWRDMHMLVDELQALQSSSIVYKYVIEDTKFINKLMNQMVKSEILSPYTLKSDYKTPFIPPHITRMNILESDYLFHVYKINKSKFAFKNGELDLSQEMVIEIDKGMGIKLRVSLIPQDGKSTILKIATGNINGLVRYSFGRKSSLALIAGFIEASKTGRSVNLKAAEMNTILLQAGLKASIKRPSKDHYGDFTKAIRDRFNHIQISPNAPPVNSKGALIDILKKIFPQRTTEFCIQRSWS